MHKYTFISTLTYEEICTRIKTCASPFKPYCLPPHNTFIYHFFDCNGFELIKTPPNLYFTGQAPFRGRIFYTSTGSHIVGKFSPPPGILRLLIPFSLLPLIPLIASGIPAVLFLYLLWVGMIFGLFYEIAPRFCRKENDAALAFIREHLLD